MKFLLTLLFSLKMAEQLPKLTSREDKIAQAKELYARGYRNYVVGDFNEAAEDLSRSCELYAQLFGDESEEASQSELVTSKFLVKLHFRFILYNIGCRSESLLWENVNRVSPVRRE